MISYDDDHDNDDDDDDDDEEDDDDDDDDEVDVKGRCKNYIAELLSLVTLHSSSCIHSGCGPIAMKRGA